MTMRMRTMHDTINDECIISPSTTHHLCFSNDEERNTDDDEVSSSPSPLPSVEHRGKIRTAIDLFFVFKRSVRRNYKNQVQSWIHSFFLSSSLRRGKESSLFFSFSSPFGHVECQEKIRTEIDLFFVFRRSVRRSYKNQVQSCIHSFFLSFSLRREKEISLFFFFSSAFGHVEGKPGLK